MDAPLRTFSFSCMIVNQARRFPVGDLDHALEKVIEKNFRECGKSELYRYIASINVHQKDATEYYVTFNRNDGNTKTPRVVKYLQFAIDSSGINPDTDLDVDIKEYFQSDFEFLDSYSKVVQLACKQNFLDTTRYYITSQYLPEVLFQTLNNIAKDVMQKYEDIFDFGIYNTWTPAFFEIKTAQNIGEGLRCMGGVECVIRFFTHTNYVSDEKKDDFQKIAVPLTNSWHTGLKIKVVNTGLAGVHHWDSSKGWLQIVPGTGEEGQQGG